MAGQSRFGPLVRGYPLRSAVHPWDYLLNPPDRPAFEELTFFTDKCRVGAGSDVDMEVGRLFADDGRDHSGKTS